MNLKWNKIKTEHIVKDRWIDFRRCTYQLPNNTEFGPFYNYSRRSYVVIIARTIDNKYLTVRQFRHGNHSKVHKRKNKRTWNISEFSFLL